MHCLANIKSLTMSSDHLSPQISRDELTGQLDLFFNSDINKIYSLAFCKFIICLHFHFESENTKFNIENGTERKTILITGGSAGIGLEAAKQFLALVQK